MELTNLDKEILYNKCVRVKKDCETQMDKVRRGEGVDVMFGRDIITITDTLIGLLAETSQLEKAKKLLGLIKELHNFAHNN